MARPEVLTRADAGRATEPASASPKTRTTIPAFGLWFALVVFAVVTGIGIRAHTLWFDELQAWNIARASHSFGDLAHNLRYEGHPILWYLPLYALTRVTGDPHAMQVLQWTIAVATAALVLFRAPFQAGVRVALLAGYFFAFEYGVFSRSYGLGALLLVWALVCLARPAPRWVWGTVALVALACTSLPGAVLALAVVATLLLDATTRRRTCARVSATSVGIVVGVVALSCIPPSDFGDLTPGLGDSSRFGGGAAVRLASSTTAVWRALVPIPASIGEWNSTLLDHRPGGVWFEALLSVGLFVVVLTALRGHGFARRLWWIGNLGLAAFFVVVTRPEAARHAGFAFLLFVACVWFACAPPLGARAELSVGRDRALLGTVVLAVLAVQIVATVAVYPSASVNDFSRDARLASAVRSAHLEGDIVSAQDWDATTIGGYLDRDVFSLARGEDIRFLTTDTREQRGVARLNVDSVRCAAHARADQVGRPIALVVAGRIPGEQEVARNDGAVVYRIGPGSLPSTCD